MREPPEPRWSGGSPDDLSEAEVDALLAGRTPAGRDDLWPLSRAIVDLRAKSEREPVPPMTSILANLVWNDPVTPAARKVVRKVTGQRAQRRPAFGRWVAAAAASMVGLGGLSAAGALPGPLQDVAHHVANVVGVDVPPSDPPPAHSHGKGEGKAVGHDRNGVPNGPEQTPPGLVDRTGQPVDPGIQGNHTGTDNPNAGGNPDSSAGGNPDSSAGGNPNANAGGASTPPTTEKVTGNPNAVIRGGNANATGGGNSNAPPDAGTPNANAGGADKP